MLQWRIQGRGLGPPFPYFWTKLKKSGRESRPSPLISRSGSGTVLLRWKKTKWQNISCISWLRNSRTTTICKWSRNSRGQLLQHLGKGNDGKEREKKETRNVICQSSPTFSPSLLPMWTSFTCFPCNINKETKRDVLWQVRHKFAFLFIPTR